MFEAKPINPKEDDLSHFADWYLNSGEVSKLYIPFEHAMVHNEEVTGITIYRYDPYQVQLWLCKPNFFIPDHKHPNVDSFEVFLYGMKFTHRGNTIVDDDMLKEQENGVPRYLHKTIRVKPNDLHGAVASEKGGAFLSIQKWLNKKPPTSVTYDWEGNHYSEQHTNDLKKHDN